MTRVTLHLAPADEYRAADPVAPYVPAAFAGDGFVHCTDGADNLAATANRYYHDDPRPYVVLVIDLDRLRSRVVYEDAARIYPHVYGPVDREAIGAVIPMPRAVDGTFLPPPNVA